MRPIEALQWPRGTHGQQTSASQLTEKIIGAAIKIHRRLGPGLLESAYEACLVFELREIGLHVEQQKAVPLIYEAVKLECGFRADLVVMGESLSRLNAKKRCIPSITPKCFRTSDCSACKSDS